MKPELSNKLMLHKIAYKNKQINIDIERNKNHIFFNFMVFIFFILCILFLAFRYLEKKNNILDDKKNIDN